MKQVIEFKGFRLDLFSKAHVMGVLNVTPDSFSDGGKFFDKSAAIDRALEMQEQGADIIDVGGMSTRPGAEAIDIDEEIRRTAPVIGAISGRVKIPVSIDTYRSDVARRGIDAGASIINDISGLRFDPKMAGLAAESKVPVIVMHIKGTPKDMQSNPYYEALIPEIIDYLRESISIAEDAGVRDIIIDPGIGFGKTFDHNLEIIKNLSEFTKLGRPVLAGPSRKAFIGHQLGGVPPSNRLMGTAAAVAACVLNGANIVRVHDVGEMSKVVRVADAIRRGRGD